MAHAGRKDTEVTHRECIEDCGTPCGPHIRANMVINPRQKGVRGKTKDEYTIQQIKTAHTQNLLNKICPTLFNP